MLASNDAVKRAIQKKMLLISILLACNESGLSDVYASEPVCESRFLDCWFSPCCDLNNNQLCLAIFWNTAEPLHLVLGAFLKLQPSVFRCYRNQSSTMSASFEISLDTAGAPVMSTGVSEQMRAIKIVTSASSVWNVAKLDGSV